MLCVDKKLNFRCLGYMYIYIVLYVGIVFTMSQFTINITITKNFFGDRVVLMVIQIEEF